MTETEPKQIFRFVLVRTETKTCLFGTLVAILEVSESVGLIVFRSLLHNKFPAFLEISLSGASGFWNFFCGSRAALRKLAGIIRIKKLMFSKSQ
jgi:hypothetical protein